VSPVSDAAVGSSVVSAPVALVVEPPLAVGSAVVAGSPEVGLTLSPETPPVPPEPASAVSVSVSAPLESSGHPASANTASSKTGAVVLEPERIMVESVT
jgi:hypothetical protein